jgi:hypothetical protein
MGEPREANKERRARELRSQNGIKKVTRSVGRK